MGGAQEYFGVVPDMTTLGKIVGGACLSGFSEESVRLWK